MQKPRWHPHAQNIPHFYVGNIFIMVEKVMPVGELDIPSPAFIKELKWMANMADANTPTDLKLFTAIRAIIARNAMLVGATFAISLGYILLDPVGQPVWIVPILVFIGLWFILVGLKEREDQRALQQSGPPKSGQWTAVCGTARALENAEDDILACRFQVFDIERGISRDDGNRSKHLTCRYDGFYLVPTGIETQHGTVRLFGFPDMVSTEKASLPNGLLDRAKKAAFFSPLMLPKPLAREIILAGIHDRVEMSLHYGIDDETVTRREIKSWMLRDGEDVCVFGYWNDGTLTTAKNRPRGLPIYKGSVEAVREQLNGLGSAFLVIGAVFLSIASGAAIWSLI